MLHVTHTPDITYGVEREDLKDKPIMARNLQDAMKWNIFIQLLTHIPALSDPEERSSRELGENNARLLENFVEKIVFAKHKKYATTPLEEYNIGGVLISFDDLKKNPELRKKLAREFVRVHNGLLTIEAKRRMEEAVDKAIAAAEKIAEMKTPYFDEFGKRKFRPVFKSPEDIYKIPELVEFLKLVEEVVPKDVLKVPLSVPPGEIPREALLKEDEEDEEFEDSEELPRADLSREAAKLLGLVKGLMLAGASGESLRNTEESLWREIKRLEGERELELIGLYAVVIAHLRENDLEGAERFLEGF